MKTTKPKKLTSADRWLAARLFSAKKRIAFYKGLAALMRNGLSAVEAADMMYRVASDEGRDSGTLEAIVMRDFLAGLKNGLGIGVALRRYVPPEDIVTLEVIRTSDNFPDQLDTYCAVLEKRGQMRATMITGMLKPIALLLGVIGMMVFFGYNLVPKVEALLPREQWTGMAVTLTYVNGFAENFAVEILVAIVVLALLVWWSLPNWTGFGRRSADRLPVYSLYRIYTGISFLMSMSALMKGGVKPVEAIDRITPMASPYVSKRLRAIRREMINGYNLGEALNRGAAGWPDKGISTSIKVFAETQDLSTQLGRMSLKWIDDAQKTVETSVAALNVMMMLLFAVVILSIMMGMFGLMGSIGQQGF